MGEVKTNKCEISMCMVELLFLGHNGAKTLYMSKIMCIVPDSYD